MQVKTPVQMRLHEFIEAYEQRPFELINGEQVFLMPSITRHSIIIRFLMRLLSAYEEEHESGVAFQETTYVLEDTSQWVTGSRIPDLCWISAKRWKAFEAAYPDYEDKPLLVVPDLCIEVISPTDKIVALDEKIQRYFEDGVRRVWAVNPSRKYVMIYSSSDDPGKRVAGDMLLEDQDILPGFSVPVATLFTARPKVR